MTATPRRALLNRAIFTQRAFDSSSLTVLTTLLHRFVAAGHYEVFIRRGGALVHRSAVHVAPEHARLQVNLDMANVAESKRGCGCEGDAAIELQTGGVLGFYVSAGTGRYSVTAVDLGAKDASNQIALDSGKRVPEGDFFALTLVQPGDYRVTAKPGGEAYVTVRLPVREKGYRPDRVMVIALGKGGFDPKSVEIFSGQSIAIRCDVPAGIRAELVKADGDVPPLERTRATFRRPAAPEGARESERGAGQRRREVK
jgi:hypothetical protein